MVDKRTRRMELFNESCALLVSYGFVAIANSSQQSILPHNAQEYQTGAPSIESWIGSIVINIVLFQLAVNLVLLASKSTIDLYLNIKRKFAKKESSSTETSTDPKTIPEIQIENVENSSSDETDFQTPA